MSIDKSKTPLLDRIRVPSDMQNLSDIELKELAVELRQETINAVSETGGHLGAGLGVVEMTVALHAVFDAPKDRIIWDVGHQAYPHKILTGRRDQMEHYGKKMVFLVLQKGMKAFMTLLEPHIVLPRYRPLWDLQ